MSKNLFNRYIWLIDTVNRAGKITFEGISGLWKHSSLGANRSFSLRTFHNHRKAIKDIFGIDISCDKNGKYSYYISNAYDRDSEDIRQWLLNSFSVNSILNESRNIRNRILFESIPSGQKWLLPVVEAMRNGEVLKLLYRHCFTTETEWRRIDPYCVKLFRQRWHLVAREHEDGKVKVFSLDRVADLSNTGDKFDYPADFDPKEYFRQSYGMMGGDKYGIETVRLKLYGNQAAYIRQHPLHDSQKEISSEEGWTIYEYVLHPTLDLCHEILSWGNSVEVLAPLWLRNNVATILRRACLIYG